MNIPKVSAQCGTFIPGVGHVVSETDAIGGLKILARRHNFIFRVEETV